MAAIQKSQKQLTSKSTDLPEIRKLYDAIVCGIDFVCKKLTTLTDDSDPNDVVKWIEKSGAMAESLITFYNILNDVDDDSVTVRGGAAIGQFEEPKRNVNG